VSAINDAGLAVGSASVPPQGIFRAVSVHAVYWAGNKITDMGTLGGPGSIALGSTLRSDRRQRQHRYRRQRHRAYYYPYFGAGGGNGGGGGGRAADPAEAREPATCRPAAPLRKPDRRGALGRAAAARTRGIGDSYVTHAFIYDAAKMIDLNTTIDPTSGWSWFRPRA